MYIYICSLEASMSTQNLCPHLFTHNKAIIFHELQFQKKKSVRPDDKMKTMLG